MEPLLTIRRALGRIRRAFVYDFFEVFARDVRAEDTEFKNPPGYRFLLATVPHIAACDELHTELNERERNEGIARIKMGHDCVIAFPTTVINSNTNTNPPAVFTMWINWNNLNIPGHIKRRLLPNQAFIYKAFTSPAHRGRKLYESGMRFTLAELHRRNKTELLGYAHVKKTVSRKGLAAVEFRTIGSFRTIGFGSFMITFSSRALRSALPNALRSSTRAAAQN
ncbi:MAG: hypothetical protein ACKVS6_10915 [Planctomycetota bacterium]